MNKLDALIESCRAAESGRIDAMEWVPHAAIRRFLEAVREDIAQASRDCTAMQNEGHCAGVCEDCPLLEHAATRAALEQSHDD